MLKKSWDYQVRNTYLVLPADVPHGEHDVLVLDSLNVETCENLNMGKKKVRL